MQPPPRDETRRLTGHLRAFGRVSADVSREPVFMDERLLRRKQKIKRASDAPEKKWCDLKMEISGRCSRTDLAKVGCWCAINRVSPTRNVGEISFFCRFKGSSDIYTVQPEKLVMLSLLLCML